MPQSGISIMNYNDDIIGNATLSKANEAFKQLKNLISELGFTISEKKPIPPSTKCTCLGIKIDNTASTLSTPQAKLQEIFPHM